MKTLLYSLVHTYTWHPYLYHFLTEPGKTGHYDHFIDDHTGNDFDITNTTPYDQKFIRDRNIFECVSVIVDDNFGNYIRRIGFMDPLSANVCSRNLRQCCTAAPGACMDKPGQALSMAPVCVPNPLGGTPTRAENSREKWHGSL